MLMLTNYDWEDCYKKVAEFSPDVLETCKRRFHTIELTQMDNLFKLADFLSQ